MNIENNLPTTVVAGACFTSPAWLPSLELMSQSAAKWAPILGALWLVIQIMNFLYKLFVGKSKDA